MNKQEEKQFQAWLKEPWAKNLTENQRIRLAFEAGLATERANANRPSLNEVLRKYFHKKGNIHGFTLDSHLITLDIFSLKEVDVLSEELRYYFSQIIINRKKERFYSGQFVNYLSDPGGTIELFFDSSYRKDLPELSKLLNELAGFPFPEPY